MQCHDCNIPAVIEFNGKYLWRDVSAWLLMNVDSDCYDLGDYSTVNNDITLRRVWFKHEHDAVTFILLWS